MNRDSFAAPRDSFNAVVSRLRLEAELKRGTGAPVELSPDLLLQLLLAAERASKLTDILVPFTQAGHVMMQLSAKISGFNPNLPPDIHAMIEKMAMILAREELTPEDFRRATNALQGAADDRAENLNRQPNPRDPYRHR